MSMMLIMVRNRATPCPSRRQAALWCLGIRSSKAAFLISTPDGNTSVVFTFSFHTFICRQGKSFYFIFFISWPVCVCVCVNKISHEPLTFVSTCLKMAATTN